jgi:hypothetical protein
MQDEQRASLYIWKQVSALKQKNVQYFEILAQAGFTIQVYSYLQSRNSNQNSPA